MTIITNKLFLSIGLGISFIGVYLMIKAQTRKDGIQEVPPDPVKYKLGFRLLVIGFLGQLFGIWGN